MYKCFHIYKHIHVCLCVCVCLILWPWICIHIHIFIWEWCQLPSFIVLHLIFWSKVSFTSETSYPICAIIIYVSPHGIQMSHHAHLIIACILGGLNSIPYTYAKSAVDDKSCIGPLFFLLVTESLWALTNPSMTSSCKSVPLLEFTQKWNHTMFVLCGGFTLLR